MLRARSSISDVTGDEAGLDDFLTAVLGEDPDDGTATALLGFHLTAVGWRVRSEFRAQYVSDRRFAEFHDWLCKAERVLVDSAARNPMDPAVHTARTPTARGLQAHERRGGPAYHRAGRLYYSTAPPTA